MANRENKEKTEIKKFEYSEDKKKTFRWNKKHVS